MRKFFYSIGVLAFLCVLSAGYYGSYQLTERRSSGIKAIPQEIRREAKAETETGLYAGRPEEINTEILEEAGGLAAEDTSEPAQAVSSVDEGETYCLKETDGYVMVYERDGITLYEATTIVASLLPESLRKEIRNGKYITSQEELYRFLENYSS